MVVVWVVLMMFWLLFGCYWTYSKEAPAGVGNTIIPWVCVLILGLVLFGAFNPPPAGVFR
jgi:hypothetical protein